MDVTSVFGIKVDASGARRGINDFNTQLGKGAAAARTFSGQVQSRFKEVKSSVFSLKGAMAGLASSLVARQIVGTIAEFEKLEVSLKTVTGSAKNAKVAMAFIKDFASETPFQVQEITNAFIKLNALGLEPSREALTSYGDTASAMGKSLNQMIEAVADASVGEFERLKEFGIKASTEGDKITFLFKGQSTTIQKESRAIQDYLIQLGQTNFAGGMSEQMDTLSGKWSNLQDNVDTLFVTLGTLGVASGSTTLLDVLIKATKSVNTELEKGRVYGLYFIESMERIRIYGTATFDVVQAAIRNALDGDYLNVFLMGYIEWGQAIVKYNPFSLIGGAFSETLDKAIDDMDAFLQKLQDSVGDDTTLDETIGKIYSDAGEEFKKAQELLNKMRLEEEAAIEANRALADSYKAPAGAITDTTDKLTDYEKALNKSAEQIRQMIVKSDPRKLFNQQIQGITELLAAGKISQQEYIDAWEIFNKQYEDKLKDNADTTDQYSKFAERAAENIQDAFADFLFDPFEASLDDMFNNLADTLRRMAAEIIAQQLLQQMFSAMAGSNTGWVAALGSAFGGTQHSGGIVGQGGNGRNVSPAAFVGAQRYHTGGIVGDEVPIIARRGEEVLTENDPRHSNNMGRRGMGGAPIYINIEAPNGRVEPESLSQLDATLAVRMGVNQKRNG